IVFLIFVTALSILAYQQKETEEKVNSQLRNQLFQNHLTSAQVAIKDGAYEKAQSEYELALRYVQEDSQMDSVQIQGKIANVQQFAQWVRKGDTAFTRQNYRTAIEAFTQAQRFQIDPKMVANRIETINSKAAEALEDYIDRARAFQKIERYALARKWYERVLEIDPNNQYALKGLRQLR
ncbi:MAG: tetratricopeptide repeat protein, partial [Bacteroidota bacterium]